MQFNSTMTSLCQNLFQTENFCSSELINNLAILCELSLRSLQKHMTDICWAEHKHVLSLPHALHKHTHIHWLCVTQSY